MTSRYWGLGVGSFMPPTPFPMSRTRARRYAVRPIVGDRLAILHQAQQQAFAHVRRPSEPFLDRVLGLDLDLAR
jgi:hypothetical protein